MGLFDRLFGKKRQEQTASAAPAAMTPEPPAARGWKARFEDAARSEDFEWTWGNALAHKLVHACLGEASADFGSPERAAKIKEIPDDEHIDLRGSYGDAPIRFAIWMSFGSFWCIEMKVPMSHHAIELQRDLDKVPKHGDADDPFDADEDRRVFVAKGVFFEGDDHSIAAKLAVWGRLPEAARESLVMGMEALDASHLMYAGDSIRLVQNPGLPELEDPIAYMRACGELLVTLRDAVAESDLATPAEVSAEVSVEGASRGWDSMRVSCSYCSSLYFASASRPRCPNCGAPPRAQ